MHSHYVVLLPFVVDTAWYNTLHLSSRKLSFSVQGLHDTLFTIVFIQHTCAALIQARLFEPPRYGDIANELRTMPQIT